MALEKFVIVFFWLAFMLYAGAFVFYAYLFITKKHLMSILATAFTVVGFIFHFLSFVIRWYSTGYFPVQGTFEILAVSTWFLVLIYLVIELLFGLKILGGLVLPLSAILLGVAWAKYQPPPQLKLAGLLRSYWVVIHVPVVFLAYGAFTLAAGLAVLYLIQEGQLKKRSVSILFRRLPSLEVLDSRCAKAIEFALPFMAMGLTMGIIRAEREVKNWILDPVVISAIITWLVYAFYLLTRWIWGWKGRKAAILALIGFGCILFIRFVAVGYSQMIKWALRL